MMNTKRLFAMVGAAAVVVAGGVMAAPVLQGDPQG